MDSSAHAEFNGAPQTQGLLVQIQSQDRSHVWKALCTQWSVCYSFTDSPQTSPGKLGWDSKLFPSNTGHLCAGNTHPLRSTASIYLPDLSPRKSVTQQAFHKSPNNWQKPNWNKPGLNWNKPLRVCLHWNAGAVVSVKTEFFHQPSAVHMGIWVGLTMLLSGFFTPLSDIINNYIYYIYNN